MEFFQPQQAAISQKTNPSFSHHQFVDISRRSSSFTTLLLSRNGELRISASMAALPSLYKRNQSFSAKHGEALNFAFVRMLDSPLVNRKLSGVRSSREQRSLLLQASASSASYSGSVEEGLLSLGGFSMGRRNLQIASGAASTIIFAVANKVLYKMALVPLKEYPFFLALVNTFGYVLVYFSILYIRYQAGIVTDEMLELPKSHFVLSGALEALGLATGMAAADDGVIQRICQERPFLYYYRLFWCGNWVSLWCS